MLVVSYYWHPWNTSGSFRWLHLSQYLKFDVLTSKKPCGGFYDGTMPMGQTKRLVRIGTGLPACINGIVLSIASWFIRADRYVYTCPPETLLLGAWINQLLGRKVYVDMRDAIDRPTQPHKWFVPVYQWLYKRIKNVCVTMQFFDPSKPVVRHGYDALKKKFDNNYFIDQSYDYAKYCTLLESGSGRNFGEGFEHYTSSSVITLRHLGNPIRGNLHPELFEFEPESWEIISQKMKRFLEL
jgi:hypothetical protein